jgi:hypothetical protein
MRCSQARRAPFIHAEVEAGVTQRGFDAQRKTGGGGRPVLMASQQMERAAELLNPEVRAELNRRVRECKRKCFASGRLGLFPQARAYARQQITRKQAGGRWCRSRAGAAHRRCDQVRRSCRRLRGYAGRGLRHTRVSRGGLARKQKDLEVREGVGIANQFSSIVSSQGSTTSSNSYPSGYSPLTTIPGKLFRHPRNLVTVEHFSPSILFTAEIHFSPVLLHNPSYPKVCLID